jgi:predicted DNA-binding transcriptional regulator YafY
MRASRLLSILMLLQTRGRMTATDLAAEAGVSVRTIYRDIDALSASGVPIFSEPGPAGGFELVAGFRTRLTGLTADEASALFLAGMPGAAAELGLGSFLAAAELKLLAALPPTLRASAEMVRERFLLDAPGWFREGDNPRHLAAIATAVWEQRMVAIRYGASDEERERTLSPLGLVLKAGIWYLVALSYSRLRTYRVSRIATLALLDGSFERPQSFDLAAYWGKSTDEFMAALYSGRATIRLSPRGFERLSHLVDQWVAHFARGSASAPDADGWVTVTIPIESEDIALTQLLQFGPDAEVVAPETLRLHLVAAANEMATLYQGA